MNMPVEIKMSIESLQVLLNTQKTSYQLAPAPSVQQRISQLTQLKNALLTYQDEMVYALDQDYGQRSTQDTLISDILPCVMNINYTIKNLKKWMKPQRRHAGLLLFPAKVTVH